MVAAWTEGHRQLPPGITVTRTLCFPTSPIRSGFPNFWLTLPYLRATFVKSDDATCAGEELDPRKVLEAMDPRVPLGEAAPLVVALLAERTHRARQAALLRALHRADNLAAHALKAQVQY